MKQSRDRVKVIIWSAIAFSLTIHISLLPSMLDLGSKLDVVKTAEKKENRIKIRFAKKKSKKQPKQIVTTEKRNLKIKNDAQFLSEFNNNTERQTQAKIVGKFNKAGAGNSNIELKAQKKSDPKISKNKNKNKKKGKGAKISFNDFMFTKTTERLKESPKKVKGLKDADKKSRGLAMNNDYLEEVPLGDMTQLNTKEYKYYGFYYRIKQRLEQHWGKSLREKMDSLSRRQGRFPAAKKHITSLRVILDGKGNIVKVHLSSSSGVKELDEAAIESFNNAGPFPNPPRGMVKNDRAFIEWGFAVTSS